MAVIENIIQIKRGGTKPDNKLAPYELGYDTSSGFLYIGGNLIKKNETEYQYGKAVGLKVEYARTLTEKLPLSLGGTGSQYVLAAAPGQSIIIKKTHNEAGQLDPHLAPFEPKNGALYYTSATLTAGTLPVNKGGTGVTTEQNFRDKFINNQIITPSKITASTGSITTLSSTTATISTLNVTSSTTLKSAKIDIVADNYRPDSTYGIHMHNSDIIGLNAMYFEDMVDSVGEGICFRRSDGKFDRLYSLDGTLYLQPETGAISHPGTRHTIYHSGNLSPFSSTGGTLSAGRVNSNSTNWIIKINASYGSGQNGGSSSIENPPIGWGAGIRFNLATSQNNADRWAGIEGYAASHWCNQSGIKFITTDLAGEVNGTATFIAGNFSSPYLSTLHGYGSNAPSGSANIGQLYFQVIS